jgi:hypothetical protein
MNTLSDRQVDIVQVSRGVKAQFCPTEANLQLSTVSVCNIQNVFMRERITAPAVTSRNVGGEQLAVFRMKQRDKFLCDCQWGICDECFPQFILHASLCLAFTFDQYCLSHHIDAGEAGIV